MTRVHLEAFECRMAAEVGLRRQLAKLGQHDAHGFNGDGWGIHIEGAAGELAVAKALNLYWSGSVDTFKVGGDVGSLQVRTRSRSDYDLIVRAADRDGDLFVLVTGKMPDLWVRGWMYGKEAKSSEFEQTYGDRPKAWFVPAAHLRRVVDLHWELS